VGSRPLDTFGANFINAAYYAYVNSEIDIYDYIEAIAATYAAGHRTAPSTIPYHAGTKLRPAAFKVGSTLFLFYVRKSDGKIVYQKRVGGSWQSPVEVSGLWAYSDVGLDAYTLPSGETRVIFKTSMGGNVFFVRVSSSGSVQGVYSFGCSGLTTVYAPAGIHDDVNERIITSHGNYLRTWDVDLCTYQDSQLNRGARGVSATEFQGNIYAIYTWKEPGYVCTDHQWITKLVGLQLVDVGQWPGPDYGCLRCDSYEGGAGGCFDATQSGNQTPNLYGVELSGARSPFSRIYVGFTNSSSEFKLHRLSFRFEGTTPIPTHRTRIVPVESGDGSSRNEVEFLRDNMLLYVFEGPRLHQIRLYY
jgi:hypothetical protein